MADSPPVAELGAEAKTNENAKLSREPLQRWTVLRYRDGAWWFRCLASPPQSSLPPPQLRPSMSGVRPPSRRSFGCVIESTALRYPPHLEPARPLTAPFGNLTIVAPKLEILARCRLQSLLLGRFIVSSGEVEFARDMTVRPELQNAIVPHSSIQSAKRCLTEITGSGQRRSTSFANLRRSNLLLCKSHLFILYGKSG
jgi:hypothetical protein